MAEEKKQKAGKGWEIKLAKKFEDKGYTFDLVASALQKCIRRGDERDACKFAYIFYASGYGKYLSRRLNTIVHEDIGLANTTALTLAGILEIRMNLSVFKTNFGGDGFLPFVNLIVLACRNKKTRLGDNLTNIVVDEIDKDENFPEIKEIFIDSHTAIGKKRFGGWQDGTEEDKQKRVRLWFSQWSLIENEDESFDCYQEELKKKWKFYG
ncbi:hypothetical protein HYV44_01675 [Candidatus Microgenomates bacterium]|nr:hypothetical protein [Candidatus Microgenomates bacterium]